MLGPLVVSRRATCINGVRIMGQCGRGGESCLAYGVGAVARR